MLLGSKETEATVLQDLDDMLTTAEQQNLKPMYLVIGRLFMDIGVAQAIQEELAIEDWEEDLGLYKAQILKVFKLKRFQIFKTSEERNGTIDKELGIKVFFDPDEYYMTLKTVDPKEKPERGKTPHITSIKLKSEEVLSKYRRIIQTQ
jgi:hypothetical protein